MKVGLAQIRPRLGDVATNIQIHREWITEAVGRQVDLLVFPELSLTGYQLLDLTMDVRRRVEQEEIALLVDQAISCDIAFGFVEQSSDHILYNSALYASAQKVLHLHRKVYLPTYGIFDEGRYFGRGQAVRRFDSRFCPVGMLVCEDFWHTSLPYLLTQDGAQVMLVMANSPVQMNQLGESSWYQLLRMHALLSGSYVIFVNRVGTEDGITFFGGSVVIDPFGQIEGRAADLQEELLVVDLELEKVRRARLQMPLLRDENIALTLRELKRIEDKRML